jgi:hypothetical protein
MHDFLCNHSGLVYKQLSRYNRIININGTGVLAFILDNVDVFVYWHSLVFLPVLKRQILYVLPAKFLWYIF